MIRLVEEDDLQALAIIYKKLYDNLDVNEQWSEESLLELLNYYYKEQKNLFFVAVSDGKIVGAIMSRIKPWFDGNRLIDTEIFVDSNFQRKSIGKKLLKKHLKEAQKLYSAKTIEIQTYGEKNSFPRSWYNNIGFYKDKIYVIMNANIKNVIEKLN